MSKPANTDDPRTQVPRELPAMFRPPVNRAMRTLDRSFFRKTVPLTSARIFQNSEISRVRKELSNTKDLLALPRLSSVQEITEQDGSVRKALLLRETVKHDGMFVRGVEWTLFLLANGYRLMIALRRQVNVVAQNY
jgi:hypothetical protein